jgi:hypothetical protein
MPTRPCRPKGNDLRAVTVRQPQAAAVFAQPGPYRLRLWCTDHRGQLLIHAARRGPGDPFPDADGEPAYGVLLGIVDLVDCVEAHAGDDPDEAGHAWVLVNPRLFAHPVPYSGRGAVGLFPVADAVVADALAEGVGGR